MNLLALMNLNTNYIQALLAISPMPIVAGQLGYLARPSASPKRGQVAKVSKQISSFSMVKKTAVQYTRCTDDAVDASMAWMGVILRVFSIAFNIVDHSKLEPNSLDPYLFSTYCLQSVNNSWTRKQRVTCPNILR